MTRRPTRKKSSQRNAAPRRSNASARTAGLYLLSSILENISAQSLREIDPDLHLDADKKGFEQRAYNYIWRHHREHKVLPTAEVLADNTGIVLPEVDQPVDYYFRRVRERAMTQNIVDPYNRLQEALQNPRRKMDEMISAIAELNNTKNKFIEAGTGIEQSDYLVQRVMQTAMARRMSGSLVGGITTGYEALDYEMDGLNKEDLVVWVGRPGRSKSWYLLHMAHAAWMAGYKPLYISMEMGGEQNMRRMLGIHSRINPTFIKKGQIQTLAMPILQQAVNELLHVRPFPMVTANFTRTVDQIASFIEEHMPDVVYIDAGYLLTPRKKRYGSSGRRETISDVIEELKELSANYKRPIVLTVQFNRQAEHRRRAGTAADGYFDPIGHLSLAEIGETDVIGQAATHVFGIEYPPAPLARHSHRVFGFLKGREGEHGWWLTRFMEHKHSPIDLSLVDRSDPIYNEVIEFARRSGEARRRPARNPGERTELMRINAA